MQNTIHLLEILDYHSNTELKNQVGNCASDVDVHSTLVQGPVIRYSYSKEKSEHVDEGTVNQRRARANVVASKVGSKCDQVRNLIVPEARISWDTDRHESDRELECHEVLGK